MTPQPFTPSDEPAGQMQHESSPEALDATSPGGIKSDSAEQSPITPEVNGSTEADQELPLMESKPVDQPATITSELTVDPSAANDDQQKAQESPSLVSTEPMGSSTSIPDVPDLIPTDRSKTVTAHVPAWLHELIAKEAQDTGTSVHKVTLGYLLNYQNYKTAYADFRTLKKAYQQLDETNAQLLQERAELVQQLEQLNEQIDRHAAQFELAQADIDEKAGLLATAHKTIEQLETQVASVSENVDGHISLATQHRTDLLRMRDESQSALKVQASHFQEIITQTIDKAAAMPTGEIIAPVAARRRELRAFAADLFDKLFRM
ncbi:hypothetical protein [Fibrella forsythiae]|uniref:Chromosome partition protein Smc n=1 Tax=Fibrella forsythiae TaxID=2817061 RepID=A0ABS3JMG3_9BACT|nr:hypothetical protein [Fibrella forsythiae]MBO0951184.1 hypothetical protein [Fibrella forsythiae]